MPVSSSRKLTNGPAFSWAINAEVNGPIWRASSVDHFRSCVAWERCQPPRSIASNSPTTRSRMEGLNKPSSMRCGNGSCMTGTWDERSRANPEPADGGRKRAPPEPEGRRRRSSGVPPLAARPVVRPLEVSMKSLDCLPRFPKLLPSALQRWIRAEKRKSPQPVRHDRIL